MKALITLALSASLAISGAALASAELATKNKCNTCHAPDKKMMGPSWKDVAAKNKGQKDAEKMLADTIVKGRANTARSRCRPNPRLRLTRPPWPSGS
jgi:cytochrome c